MVNLLGSDAIAEYFRKNTEGVDKIRLIRGSSLHVASTLDKSDLDLIFIDAGHDYESVTEDIMSWFPHLSENGVMIGHDYYADVWPGVVQAVDEFFGNTVVRVFEGTSLWMVNKKDYNKWKKSAEN